LVLECLDNSAASESTVEEERVSLTNNDSGINEAKPQQKESDSHLNNRGDANVNNPNNTTQNTELDKKTPVIAQVSGPVERSGVGGGVPLAELSPHTSTPKILNTSGNNKTQPRIEDPVEKTPEQVKLIFDDDEAEKTSSDQKESMKITSNDEQKKPAETIQNKDCYDLKTNNNNINNKDFLKKQIKTSDYESMSSSVVDDVLSRLTSTPETSNKTQQVWESKTKSRDVSSDLVFEDCKNVVDDHDKGNLNKIFPGQYYGQARHRDGSMLPILFEVCCYSLEFDNYVHITRIYELTRGVGATLLQRYFTILTS